MDHIGQNELIQLPKSIFANSNECIKIIKVHSFDTWIKLLKTEPAVAKKA